MEQLKEFKNINFVKADITSEFVQSISNSDETVLFSSVGKTNAKLYKQIKMMLAEMKKDVAIEALV